MPQHPRMDGKHGIVTLASYVDIALSGSGTVEFRIGFLILQKK